MICPTCFEDTVINQALGKTFHYCRTCKVEVKGRKRQVESLDLEGMDLGTLTEEEQQEFDAWLSGIPTSISNDDGPDIDYYDDDLDGGD